METERLIIDRFRESDKTDYFTNVTHDKRVLETFVCKYTETPDELDFTPYLAHKDFFAVRLKESGRAIGIILWFGEKEEENGRSCEIGYALGHDYWGRGYMTEALQRLLRFCFEEKGFTRVYASFFKENVASKRVMEKSGMKFDRFAEKALTYLGAERDLVFYSIGREEFLSSMREGRD